MIALLLGVGALFLALVATALLDPRQCDTERAGDHVPSLDAISLVA